MAANPTLAEQAQSGLADPKEVVAAATVSHKKSTCAKAAPDQVVTEEGTTSAVGGGKKKCGKAAKVVDVVDAPVIEPRRSTRK